MEHSMRSEEGCCPTYTSHHFADDCRPASSSASVSSLVGILSAVAAAGVVVGGAMAVVCGESLEAMADGLSSAVG